MAKKNTPRIVRAPVMVKGYSHQRTLGGYDLEGTIDEVIAKLEQLKVDYPDKNLCLSWEQEKYEDFHSLHLYENRPETAKEKAAREAHARETREHEIRMLKKLQEKYPDA